MEKCGECATRLEETRMERTKMLLKKAGSGNVRARDRKREKEKRERRRKRFSIATAQFSFSLIFPCISERQHRRVYCSFSPIPLRVTTRYVKKNVGGQKRQQQQPQFFLSSNLMSSLRMTSFFH